MIDESPPKRPLQKNAPFKIKNAHKGAVAPTLGITGVTFMLRRNIPDTSL